MYEKTDSKINQRNRCCMPNLCKENFPLRWFKLTIGSSKLRFNHRFKFDIMWINNNPVIHMADKGTHSSAARFIMQQTSRDICKSILSIWTLLYCGPPDHQRIDQGTNYTSAEFRNLLIFYFSLKFISFFHYFCGRSSSSLFTSRCLPNFFGSSSFSL